MTEGVTLESAGAGDATLLGNLMELYIHDLSAVFRHVKLGPDGRFGYPALGSYLSASGERFGFVIRCEGEVAGFVLARRGSPASEDPNVLDVAEFFVLRSFRERGVGQAAARLLWGAMRGKWVIRALVRNTKAVGFWRALVSAYTNGRYEERERMDGSSKWVVLSFDSSQSA
ncbi:MAG: GNAT family N-acetyltransferase [Myxococcota bacterium]